MSEQFDRYAAKRRCLGLGQRGYKLVTRALDSLSTDDFVAVEAEMIFLCREIEAEADRGGWAIDISYARFDDDEKFRYVPFKVLAAAGYFFKDANPGFEVLATEDSPNGFTTIFIAWGPVAVESGRVAFKSERPAP